MAHVSHSAAPGAETAPGGHVRHASNDAAPSSGRYDPIGHAAHAVALATSLTDPGAQGEQTPGAEEKVPGRQGTQSPAAGTAGDEAEASQNGLDAAHATKLNASSGAKGTGGRRTVLSW